MTIELSAGFRETERDAVAHLYWQAFQRKLRIPLGPEHRARAFLARVLDPQFAIAARQDGQLLGIAGFKTSQGALVGGTIRDMWAVFGLSCVWRLPLISLLERSLESNTLLMDGIFVAEQARGRGIGTLLLAEIKREATRRNMAHVRLDVIDTNPRARALYERVGFRPGRVEKLGALGNVFGFSSATEMTFDLRGPTP